MRAALIILVPLILLGCDSTIKQEESRKLTVQSHELIEEGKLDDAKLLLEKAIELWPENYVAYNNMAIIGIHQNKPSSEIIANFQKSLSIKSDYEIALYSLVGYYSEIREYQNEVQAANKYIQHFGDDASQVDRLQEIYAHRAEAKYQCGRFEEAMQDARVAISMNGNTPGVHKTLGDCYYQIHAMSAAIDEYSAAIRLDTAYFQAYLARGRTYESLDLPSSERLAREDYLSALKINNKALSLYGLSTPLSEKASQEITIPK